MILQSLYTIFISQKCYSGPEHFGCFAGTKHGTQNHVVSGRPNSTLHFCLVCDQPIPFFSKQTDGNKACFVVFFLWLFLAFVVFVFLLI